MRAKFTAGPVVLRLIFIGGLLPLSCKLKHFNAHDFSKTVHLLDMAFTTSKVDLRIPKVAWTALQQMTLNSHTLTKEVCTKRYIIASL